MQTNTKKIEFALWALAFLDLLGFGMLIPDGQIRLDSMGVPGLAIGMILSSMFVVQFIVSPMWGRMSDRTGRKPIIVICTLFSAGAMLVYALARDPMMILASRILAGFGAANIAIAQAYIADLSASGSKLAAMGRIGAAISSGLIVGPAIGGFLAAHGGNFLLGVVASIASASGALLALFILPKVPPSPQKEKPKGTFSLLSQVPGLTRIFLVISIGWLALATLEGTFGRLIKDNLGMGQKEFGIIFGYESLLGVLIQALLLKWVEKKFNQSVALRLSYVLMGLGLILYPVAPGMWALLLASTIYALGSSIANPTANAICSELAPEDRQGELFGLMQTARSFGFWVGPMIGGWLFDYWHAAPYVLAALVCLVATLAVPKLHQKTTTLV